jgi:hypothetical protein
MFASAARKKLQAAIEAATDPAECSQSRQCSIESFCQIKLGHVCRSPDVNCRNLRLEYLVATKTVLRFRS